MNIEAKEKRLGELKHRIDVELDELYNGLENERFYFADVEMYENVLLQANELAIMAHQCIHVLKLLRKNLVDVLEERETE